MRLTLNIFCITKGHLQLQWHLLTLQPITLTYVVIAGKKFFQVDPVRNCRTAICTRSIKGPEPLCELLCTTQDRKWYRNSLNEQIFKEAILSPKHPRKGHTESIATYCFCHLSSTTIRKKQKMNTLWIANGEGQEYQDRRNLGWRGQPPSTFC